MSKFFANVWTKRVVAVLSIVYMLFVCRLCYFSIFYDMHINDRVSTCLAVSGVSLAALIVMLYTRHQILTRIASFVILPAMLPVVLLYFGEWGLIIPIIAAGIIILLLSGAGEGIKTALATIILLMYIFGALGYFLFSTFFVASVKEQVVDTGVSPSGTYRYRVVNTEDTSNGSTAVYVEPNYADVKNTFATFTLKNQEHIVYMNRPVQSKVDISWTTQNRQEITDKLNSISDEIEVTVTDAELKRLGYTYDNKLMLSNLSASRKFALGLTASDVDPVPLDTLNAEQLDFFGIGKEADGRYYILDPDPLVIEKNGTDPGERIYFSEIKPKALKIYNRLNVDPPTGITYFNVTKSHTVMLNTLTDAQLADLGVSESGDVMLLSSSKMVVAEEDKNKEDAVPTEEVVTAKDKIVFRYYVAELEDYFDVNSRRLTLDLLN
ncbi:hypothetical protein [Ruminococcus flavefaciens]|uniref:hypothetical protein n=1 Tax=Ruminococcus flavefaciens TaxID=1265 RepID=UPI0026EB5F03|nr:hypothetical protein [Ruminococcus flavefaciens]